MTLVAPGVFRRPFSLLAFHARLVAQWEAAVIAHNLRIDSSGYAYEPPENRHEAVLAQFTPKARSLARTG